MLQTLLPLALALSSFLPQGPAGRDAEAVALLERARDAASALTSGAYAARSEVRQGNAQAQPAIAEGRVRFEAVELEEPIGAKLAVDGKAPGGGPGGGDLVFRVAYDGATVRGQIGAEKVVWEGSITGDGGEILSIGQPLMLDELHSKTPFADDVRAADVQLAEDVVIQGVDCRTVVVQHGPRLKYAKHVWFLSKEDDLPRGRVAEVHRRGVFTIEKVEISKLIQNPEIYPAVFQFPIPAGYEVKAFVSQRPKGPELLAVGSVAPPLALKDSAGKTHDLADYRGKVLVLDFWSTWCPPCEQTMPVVQRLQDLYADSDDVLVFGIALNERSDVDPAAHMKAKGFTYPCLLNGETVAEAYKVAGPPTFYVVDQAGVVIHASVGFDAGLDVKVKALVDEARAGHGGALR
jgi:thiol-disulfide isomerase/thioredoxin